jgi:hypothetical protein
MSNTSKIFAVLLKIFAVLAWFSILAVMLSILTDNNKEKKCIDGTVHSLKDNSYWLASNNACKPLTIEERRK